MQGKQLAVAGDRRRGPRVGGKARDHRGGIQQPPLGETDNTVLNDRGLCGEMTVRTGPSCAGRVVPARFDRDDIRRDGAMLTAAVSPAITSTAGIDRCSSSTSISCRVPAASPFTFLVAAQNASCAAVNTPAVRARANAVEPGRAPGLICSTSK